MRKYFPVEKDLDGFNEFLPSDHIPVAGLPDAIREQKSAWLNTISVRAVFSAEVEDGDLVVPVVRDETNDWYHPDTVWVPALGPDAVMQAETETSATYQPKFYGMAYKGLNRVMLGPLVYHPTYKFRAGDILYATTNGKMTTEQTEVFVGACLAPGYVLLHGTAQNIDLFKKAAELTERAETAASTSVEMATQVVEVGEAQIKRMEELADQLLILGVSYNKYAVADISVQTAEGTQIALPEYEGAQMSYIVGSNTLLLCYNGTWMLPGEQYTEVGTAGLPSAVIQLSQELRPGDKLGVLILSQYTKVLLSVDSGLGFKENGELFIAPVTTSGSTTPRYLADRFADVINVRDFGAVGDGVTDDTSAFEAAAATGRAAFVPEGKYALSRAVDGFFFSFGDIEFTGQATLRIPLRLATIKDVINEREQRKANEMMSPCLWPLVGKDVGLDYPQLVEGDSTAWNAATQSAFVDSFDSIMYLAQMNAQTGTMRLVAMRWSSIPSERTLLAKTTYAYDRCGHQSNSLYRPTKYDEPLLFCPGHYYDSFSNEVLAGSKKYYVDVLKWDYLSNTQPERIYRLRLFDAGQYTSDNYFAATVSVDSEFLIAEAVKTTTSTRVCRIWKVEEVLAYAKTAEPDSNGHISVEHLALREFPVPSSMTSTGQGIYSDGVYIYHLSGAEYPTISFMDFSGSFIDKYTIKNKYVADEWEGQTVTYEPEGIFWVKNSANVEPYLHISATVAGVRKNRFFALAANPGWPYPVQGLYRDKSESLCVTGVGRLPVERGSVYDLFRLFHVRAQNQDHNNTTYIGLASERTNGTIGVDELYSALLINFVEKGQYATRFKFACQNTYNDADDTVTLHSGFFACTSDNVVTLGHANYRWSQLYAATDTINTSDAREKTAVSDPDEALMRAWGRVNFKAFQFADSVEKKGEDARIHFGVIAQQVQEAFASEGLDARRYALFCYDKWEDVWEEQEDGTKVLVTPAGDRYGIRYSEALALECAYQRWLGEKREQRLAKLEALMGVTNG